MLRDKRERDFRRELRPIARLNVAAKFERLRHSGVRSWVFAGNVKGNVPVEHTECRNGYIRTNMRDWIEETRQVVS